MDERQGEEPASAAAASQSRRERLDPVAYAAKQNLESNLSRVHYLLNLGVFTAPVLRPFHEPVFVSVILKLHDLLQLLRMQNRRVDFTDDVPGGGDITDLVSKVRNAIAHTSSPENLLDKDSHLLFVFNMIAGKGQPISLPGAQVFVSDYDDDIAFFYGSHRLYLKRHLFRSVMEAFARYQAMYPGDADPFLLALHM